MGVIPGGCLELLGEACAVGISRTSLEATQVSTDGWTGKHNVVQSYDGVVFSLKEECNSDTCCDVRKS